MARVDRLDRDVRRVLQVAAVVGHSFFYRVLEAVDYIDTKLDQHLAELEQVGLTHLEMGWRLRERYHLEQAVQIFSKLGAAWDLARARQDLGM